MVFWEFEGIKSKSDFPIASSANTDDLLKQQEVFKKVLREKLKILDQHNHDQKTTIVKQLMKENQLM